MSIMRVHTTQEIDFPPAAVWELLGGFDRLPMISTGTVMSRLVEQGRVRVLTNRDGGILWERLTRFDEARRLLSYEIIDAKGCDALAYGVGYKGTVRVRARRGGRAATYDYIAEFVPQRRIAPKEARAAVQAFAADCAAGVRRVLSRR